MSRRMLALLAGGLIVMQAGCASLGPAEQARLGEIRAAGLGDGELKKKSPGLAGGLNLLPGIGNFYLASGTDETPQVTVGVLNLLLWPVSVVWGVPQAAIDANTINRKQTVYYYTYDPVGKEQYAAATQSNQAPTPVNMLATVAGGGTTTNTTATAATVEVQVNAGLIPDNTGEYMCPWTSDGVLAEWVDKAINARMGAAAGSAVGAYAGSRAMEQVPLIGGWLGSKVGKASGRAIAIKAAGGEEYIRATSDQSFNSLDAMARYVTHHYGTSSNFGDALKATEEIYPGFTQAVSRVSMR